MALKLSSDIQRQVFLTGIVGPRSARYRHLERLPFMTQLQMLTIVALGWASATGIALFLMA